MVQLIKRNIKKSGRRIRLYENNFINCKFLYFTLLILKSITILKVAAKEFYNEEVFTVKPTPALHMDNNDLTTVLFVPNHNRGAMNWNHGSHGRIINVRPEVGLVTSSTRTFIHEGVTTQYATQVVGTTFDNGRIYAQFLKKSSRVLYNSDLLPSVITSWVGNGIFSQTSLEVNQQTNKLETNIVFNTDVAGVPEYKSTTTNFFLKNIVSSSLVPSNNIFLSSSDKENNISSHSIQSEASEKVSPNLNLLTYTIMNTHIPTSSRDNFSNEIYTAYRIRKPKVVKDEHFYTTDAGEATKFIGEFTQRTVHLPTVTYYGFADFTTIVGDNIIVFSPSSVSVYTNLSAHITTIKGNPTLSNQYQQTATHIQPSSISSNESNMAYINNNNVQEALNKKDDMETIFITSTETSITSSLKTESVMLSRPSPEEVQQIYQVLASAESNKKKSNLSEILNSRLIIMPTITSMLSTNLQTVQGVTTIFFEDNLSDIRNISPVNSELTLSTSIIKNMNVDSELRENNNNNTKSMLSDEHDPNVDSGLSDFTNNVVSINIKTKPKYMYKAKTGKKLTNKFSYSNSELENETITMDTIVSLLKTDVDMNYNAKINQFNDQIMINSELYTEEDDIEYVDNNSERNTENSNNNIDNNHNDIKIINDNDDIELIYKTLYTTYTYLTTYFNEDNSATSTASIESRTEIISNVITTTANDNLQTNHMAETEIIPSIQASLYISNDLMSYINKSIHMDNIKITEDSNVIDNDDKNKSINNIVMLKNKLSVNPAKTYYTTYTYYTTLFNNNDHNKLMISHTEVHTNVVKPTVSDEIYNYDVKNDNTDVIYNNNNNDNEFISRPKVCINVQNSKVSSDHVYNDTITSDNNDTNGKSVASNITYEELTESSTNNYDNNHENFDSNKNAAEDIIKHKLNVNSENSFKKNGNIINENNKIHDNNICTNKYYNNNTLKQNSDYNNMENDELKSLENDFIYIFRDEKSYTDNNVHFNNDDDDDNNDRTIDLDADTPIITKDCFENNTLNNMKYNETNILKNNITMRFTNNKTLSKSNLISNQDLILVLNHNEHLLNEDQISLESNTDDDFLPSSTLILQTSYTTFTYYTTMYSGNTSSVFSHLETITSTVTETLKPIVSATILGDNAKVDDAILPITYFTTYTYWTKLARNGQISTISREEIISNVITPSNLIESSSIERIIPTSTILRTEMEKINPSIRMIETVSMNEIELTEKSDISMKSIIEIPTTYYTTYTYYTTAYEEDEMIINSHLETITNIITPTFTSVTSSLPINLNSFVNLKTNSVQIELNRSQPILYDYKKIIDADGISTIYLTTELQSDINTDGDYTEILKSSSSIYINETKKSLLATDMSTVNVNSDTTSNDYPKSYKTGLVRLIEGTRIGNGTTTLYQSRVLGTIIDQRYAQIIESTSSFLFEKTRMEFNETNSITSTSVLFGNNTMENKIEENLDDSQNQGDENSSINTTPLSIIKRTFSPVIRPFVGRNRLQFAPKRNSLVPSSVTVITRSDITPTITATPALKSTLQISNRTNRFLSTSISGTTLSSTTIRRQFTRPLKSIIPLTTRQRISTNQYGQSVRNNLLSSIRRTNFVAISKPISNHPSLTPTYSSVPTSKSNIYLSSKIENMTININSTSNNNFRRKINPFLRVRRPFTQQTVRAFPSTQSIQSSTLRSRLSITTTLSTKLSRLRTTQIPIIGINRLHSSSNLFPSRDALSSYRNLNKFSIQSKQNNEKVDIDDNYQKKNDEKIDENNEYYENNGNNDSDDTFDIEDDIYDNDNTYDINRRRKRSKRQVYNSRNFRSRRLRIMSANISNDITNDSNGKSNRNIISGQMQTSLGTIYQRKAPRIINGQHSPHYSIMTSDNLKNYIRPTRPIIQHESRAPFTLRDKDSNQNTFGQSMSKPNNNRLRSNLRRPTTRSYRPPSSANIAVNNNRRSKIYANNSENTTSNRNFITTNRDSPRNRNRSRNRNRIDQNVDTFAFNNNNNEKNATITVTFLIPSEITVPVINGKMTEYKQVITAKTSTDVLLPEHYTSFIDNNGQNQLALTREDSTVNLIGFTEITKYILHSTPTTTITFTPTTIRGRKTSFSHVLPSTIYSVESFVSTIQPQLSANAPLANILLSQLLLGSNIRLPTNPLLSVLIDGAGTLLPSTSSLAITSLGKPTTEYHTHASTYITTVYEGQSTVLPVTFQGKKILTTVYDTTAQTITATEIITDTIVVTPTIQNVIASQGQSNNINNILLQQLLLQQSLQQASQLQVMAPIDTLAFSPLYKTLMPQLLTGNDNNNLQDLQDAMHPIKANYKFYNNENYNRDDSQHSNNNDIIDDFEQIDQMQNSQISNDKKLRNKSNKINKNRREQQMVNAASSVITLYVSGKRPGEFSTILSTVALQPDITLYKRHVTSTPIHIENSIYDDNNMKGIINENILDTYHHNLNTLEEHYKVTQDLESVIGDVSKWHIHLNTNTVNILKSTSVKIKHLMHTM